MHLNYKKAFHEHNHLAVGAVIMINRAMPLWSREINAVSPSWSVTLKQKLTSIQVVVAILLVHALIFYALQQGMFKQIIPALPSEIVTTLIAANTPTQRPTSPVAKPKTVNHASIPTPSPVNNVVNTTPDPEPSLAPAASEAAATMITLASAALPAANPEPKTITSGVDYLQAPRPEYPAASRRLHEQGKTLLRVLINQQGQPEKAEIQQSSGSARLDEAARQAVLAALFKPYSENGKSIAVYALVPIRFQLNA